MRVTANQSRLFFFVFAAAMALPLSLGWLTGIFVWTSPLVFLVSFAYHSLVLFSLLGFFSLVFITLWPRWYCRWMCPTGVLCDGVSKLSRRRWLKNMPSLGMLFAALIFGAALAGVPALSMLDPVVIFYAFFHVWHEPSLLPLLAGTSGLVIIVGTNLISRFVWCQKLCPLGGMQDALTTIRKIVVGKNKSRFFDRGRRAAIGAIGGFGLGLILKKSIPASTLMRPPGARPDGEFQSTCIRCGNCITVCPTNILHPVLNPVDMISLLTPYVSFTNGYCLPSCTSCGAVCPSGAIKRFSREEKKRLVLAAVTIDLENCLLSHFKECDRCRFYCAYDAILIRIAEFGLTAHVEVIKDKCVGCGACVVVCPVGVISIKKSTERQNLTNA